MLDRVHLFPGKTGALSVSLLVALAGWACSKTEVASLATSTSSASSSPKAPVVAKRTASTDAADAGDAAPSATASGAARVASAEPLASASAGPLSCGTKPLPDCPLQAWMKANMNALITENDLPALAIALDKVVAFAPPGYTNWVSISTDGAKAARAGETSATKASCRGCHDQYKDKYKREMRARKI